MTKFLIIDCKEFLSKVECVSTSSSTTLRKVLIEELMCIHVVCTSTTTTTSSPLSYFARFSSSDKTS